MNSNTNSENAPGIQGKSVAKVLRFCVAQLFMVIFWPLAVLGILLVSLISGIFLDETSHRRLGQQAVGLGFGIFIKGLEILKIVRVCDDDLRKHAHTDGPLIIACNHPALWDAPLMIRRLVRVTCIMKKDLLENPMLRNGALFAGFLPNAPRLLMIRMAVERLTSGGRLLLFPEGTRSGRKNGAVNPFLPGLALLAKKSGAPVLPVFISSNSRYLQKGWPLWKMPDLPIGISIRVGELLTAQPDEKVRVFSERMEAVFRKELG